MALFPLTPGLHPLGQYDVVNTEVSSLLGGEVLTFTTASRSNTSTEQAAFDAEDGYIFDVTVPIANRPAATRASTASQVPLFLCDDGSAVGYSTLFGVLIGGVAGVGTSVSGSTTIGPSTILGSGKATLWDKPGLYAVSTDAVASDFITSISTGSSAGLAPGTSVGFGNSTDIGKLAHNSCANKVASSGVANFVEFESAPTTQSMASLVTTSPRLLGATEVFNRVVIWFHSGLGVRTL